MRAVAIIVSLFVMVALLGGIVYWALPFLTSKPPTISKKPELILIGLDISKSNPLVVDSLYASKVAKRVGGDVSDLKLRDEVMIRTFGTYDPREQPLHLDQQVTTENTADSVSALASGIIAGVPTLVKRGTLKSQDATNIVGFLQNMAQVVNCKKNAVTVILASDGVEESDVARMTSLTATLPKPETPLFKGCKSLQILGLGVGAKNPAMIERLRSQWAAWAEAAGFKDFQGLNDW